MLLNDLAIQYRVTYQKMIEPFEPSCISECAADFSGQPGLKRVLSYGCSSYGYDARLAPKFRIFTPINGSILDPKHFDPASYVDREGDTCLIPPHSFVLATTLEYFRIPRDILAICVGKSTYARCGVFTGTTPLEPEWCGNVTIEIANVTDLPARIYANEGFCQFLFLQSASLCKTSYADRNSGVGGKYQNQTGIQTAKV